MFHHQVYIYDARKSMNKTIFVVVEHKTNLKRFKFWNFKKNHFELFLCYSEKKYDKAKNNVAPFL